MDEARVVLRCAARGFAFDVVLGEAELREPVTELLTALLRRGGTAAAEFFVSRAGGGGQWHVWMDGQLMMACEQRGEALHGLIVFINERVVAARDDLLSVHAAGVATAGGAVVLPADAGSGKTTLCGRLLQRGAAYLSDDSIALDGLGRVVGYPKPLGFKVGTWEQFADAGLADLGGGDGTQLVWQVPPGRLGAQSVAEADTVAVVVPRFESGATLRLQPLSRPDTAGVILGQAQNLGAFGLSEALDLIAAVAARIPGYSCVYGDARDAAPAVLDTIKPLSGPSASYRLVQARPSPGASQPRPRPDVMALCYEDGALLVLPDASELIVVDPVGAVMWPLMDGHRTIDSIATELAPQFGASSREIESDVGGWVAALVDRGFLVPPSR